MAAPQPVRMSERVRARLIQSLPGRAWLRLREVEFLDRGVVLAAQAFLALFPMLIVVAAVLPNAAGQGIVNVTRTRLGIAGTTEESLGQLIAAREDIQGSVGVISVFMLIVTATSFTRVLQRVYERAWQLPPAGARASWRGLVWLVGAIAYLGLLGFAARLTARLPYATPARALGAVVAAFCLWWWSQRMLTARRVRWRALIPGAALSAVGMLTLSVLSARIVPRMIESNQSTLGTAGVIFALVSWLIVIGTVLVVTATVGALLAQEDSRIGRLMRGAAHPDGWREGWAGRPDTEAGEQLTPGDEGITRVG
jgi:membrane protein